MYRYLILSFLNIYGQLLILHFFILGYLNQPISQIWESDFDRFMTSKHGNPIVRQQSNLSWTEQFLDGKEKISSKALKTLLSYWSILIPNYLIFVQIIL